MLIICPTGTDAPIYHWPIATGLIILTSIACFVLQLNFPAAMEMFYLYHGFFNPLTWVTHSFVHRGIGQLLGNMFLLACVGLLVEGRCGPWKFLGAFFAVGIISGFIQQLIFLPMGFDTYSGGASGCIYGLFAIAMMWMPENKVNFFIAGWVLFFPFLRNFSANVMSVVFILIGIEFLIVWFSFFSLSSSMLHLLGAIPGFGIGYLMLVRKWVDCEGGDLLTTSFGMKPKMTGAEKKKLQLEKEQRKETRKQAIAETKRKIGEHVGQGRYDLAIRHLESLRRKLHSEANFTPAEMYKIVKAYDADPDKRQQSMFLLNRYLKEQPDAPAILVIANARQYLVYKDSPRKALSVLKRIEASQLSEQEKRLVAKLTKVAAKQIRDGSLEVSE